MNIHFPSRPARRRTPLGRCPWLFPIGLLPLMLAACGNGGQVTSIRVLAGNNGGPGWIDGRGPQARFFGPEGVAIDAAGTIYIADTQNNLIRKITPDGLVTSLAGAPGIAGDVDGQVDAAQFNGPAALAVDRHGTLYVADTENDTIRKVTPDGTVTTMAGSPGEKGAVDGIGAAARFDEPQGIAVDANGTVYVADSNNDTIRKLTPAGVVTTIAGKAGDTNSGSADGPGTAARFLDPIGIAVDANGVLYVADSGNNTIRKITPAGLVTTLAGHPGTPNSTDATGAAARFYKPMGVAVDGAGNVYVADTANTIRKITSAGAVTTLAGSPVNDGSADGQGAAANFSAPDGVAVDAHGNVYVADTGSDTIRKITPGGAVTTLAGSPPQTGDVDGQGNAALFSAPAGLATDASGNVYVADTENDSIRKITPEGVVSTFAGGKLGHSDMAGGYDMASWFTLPNGVAVDAQGNVYVADTQSNAIRKLSPSGAFSTLAGDPPNAGSSDGTGKAASFTSPTGIAVDDHGNVYVTDTDNDTIRKITPDRQVTTLAGTAGEQGDADGTGAAARFSGPSGIAVSASGDLYVTDTFNDTIRKITPAGVVTTLAGSAGVPGRTDGTGSAALFIQPGAIAIGTDGNLYVADTGSDAIRKVTPQGVVTTIISNTLHTRPGQPPISISQPSGIAILGRDRLVFTSANAILIATRRGGF